MTNAVNLEALHQYSDDSEIVSLVKSYLDTVDENGIIRSPDKFEAEPIHTVYFYGWLMQGEGDDHYVECEHVTSPIYVECDCESDIEYTQFHIDAGDEEAFPITLKDCAGKNLRIREDSQGFVYSWVVDDNS